MLLLSVFVLNDIDLRRFDEWFINFIKDHYVSQPCVGVYGYGVDMTPGDRHLAVIYIIINTCQLNKMLVNNILNICLQNNTEK